MRWTTRAALTLAATVSTAAAVAGVAAGPAVAKTYPPPRINLLCATAPVNGGGSDSLLGGNEYRPRGTAAWFLRGSDSIASCFVARTEPVEPVEAPATLDFDANGVVAKATIGDLQNLFRPDERACITKKLMTIRSPCPSAPP